MLTINVMSVKSVQREESRESQSERPTDLFKLLEFRSRSFVKYYWPDSSAAATKDNCEENTKLV